MNKGKKMCGVCGCVIKGFPGSSRLVPKLDVCSSCASLEAFVNPEVGRAIRVRMEFLMKQLGTEAVRPEHQKDYWDKAMKKATLAIRKEREVRVRRITANRRKEVAKKPLFPIHQRIEDDTNHSKWMKG